MPESRTDSIRPRPARLCRAFLALLLATLIGQLSAADRPRIALVIDDAGYQWRHDQRVLDLDTRVALAIIPEAPHATALARQAMRQGRAVIVHLPLGGLVHDNCQQGLTCLGIDWSVDRMQSQLERQLERVPGAVGLNNHQGSQFTRDSGAVERLVRALTRIEATRTAPLIVLDSRTVADSQLERVALAAGLPTLRRRVFLDHRNDPESIARAWQDLLDQAHYHGSALAIGHPRPATIDFLTRALRDLDRTGVVLVAIGEMAAPTGPGQQAQGASTAP